MADFVFRSGPVDTLDSDWLGLSSYYPSPNQQLILSNSSNYTTGFHLTYLDCRNINTRGDQSLLGLAKSAQNRLMSNPLNQSYFGSDYCFGFGSGCYFGSGSGFGYLNRCYRTH